MPRTRLLPILIVLLSVAPPALPEPPDSGAAAPSARSTRSGPVQLTNSANSSWDPSILVDGSGNIHLAWQDGTDKTSIRYKSFAPSGEVTVNDTVLVNYYDPQPPVYVSGRPYSPRLDHNNGSLVLFWNSTENHPSGQTDHDENLRMLRFSPDLKTRRECWLPIYAIDRLYYGNPLYAFDSKGNMHFAYAGNSEWYGEPYVWYVKTNSTGARLFSKFLAKNETEVGVAVDAWDNVHLVWRNETGNLTYSRLDQNGTETCRIDQIRGINFSIFHFTIVAKRNSPGANIFWNEWDIHMCSISLNGTARTVFLHQGQGQGQIFNYDLRYPFVAESDARGLNHLFGYGHIERQGGHTFPYDIIMGMTDEEGTRQLHFQTVEGMDLVDKGYSGVGPPFSAQVTLPDQSGSYAHVAYSDDRLAWEDPPGGMNIYLDILGPYTADLRTAWIGFSDQGPLEKDNITIRVEVEYFSSYPPATYPMDFDVELFVDGALAGSSHGSVFKMDTVNFNWTATGGLHNFTARIVSGLAELNLTNNEMNASLYVYGRPDISVEDIVWDPPSPAVGDRVNISARVLNSGETAGDFSWCIELNGSVLEGAAARLGPGERANCSTEWTAGLPGSYSVVAAMDGTDPYELELSNNSLKRTITVAPAVFSVEILSPADGSRVNGTFEIAGRVVSVWGEPVLRLALGDSPALELLLFSDGSWRRSWDTTAVPNGWYNISAAATNGWVESMASVRVLVDNPMPKVAFSPPQDIAATESAQVEFVSQVLWARPLEADFQWTVNGIGIAENETEWPCGKFSLYKERYDDGPISSLLFSTNWSSSGRYTVKVVVGYFYFGKVETSFCWNLSVMNFNTPPVLREWSPVYWNNTAYPNERIHFWAKAEDFEDDDLQYSWFVDGQKAAESGNFAFVAKGGPGARNIKVVVSDGEFEISRNWTVTVLPRAPAPTTGPACWPWVLAAVICGVAAIGAWMVRRKGGRPGIV